MNKYSDRVYSGQSIGKLNYFLDNKKDSPVLFLGSSRVSRHFVSNEIYTNSFNMGMDGTKIAYSSTIFKTLSSDIPQIIFYHIDPEYATDIEYNGKDIKSLITKYNRNPIIKKEIEYFNQDNPFQNILKSISYNGKLLGILYNLIRPDDLFSKQNGYQPNYTSDEQQENLKKQVEQKRIEPLKNCDNLEINNIYRTKIKELKTIADQSSKTLIFITSPRYLDRCKRDNEVLSEYMNDLGVNYIDDTEFFQGKNRNNYWKDVGHLADDGAKLYSVRIKEILASILK